MASSSLRRWPTAATPISFRSSAVSRGRTSVSTSLSLKACSYWPSPSARSQDPTSTSLASEDQHAVGLGGEPDRVAGCGAINGGEADLDAVRCGGGAVELAATILGGDDGGRNAALGYREEVVRADGGHHLGGGERLAGGAVEEGAGDLDAGAVAVEVDEAA